MRALPFAFMALAAAPAFADEALAPTQEAELSARLGAFLPFTNAPATPASNVRSFGVYDGARKSTAVQLDTTALFASWFQLQAGATYEESDIHSHVLAQLGLLEADKHGVDLQLGVGWQERGINGVSAARVQLAIGHELASTYVTTAAAFDIGLDDSERGIAFNAAAMHAIRTGLYAGVDSELALDLERDAAEPMDESTWQLKAGPVATYAVERFTVTASAGVAVDKPRMDPREAGVFGLVGLGAAF